MIHVFKGFPKKTKKGGGGKVQGFCRLLLRFVQVKVIDAKPVLAFKCDWPLKRSHDLDLTKTQY